MTLSPRLSLNCDSAATFISKLIDPNACLSTQYTWQLSRLWSRHPYYIAKNIYVYLLQNTELWLARLYRYKIITLAADFSHSFGCQKIVVLRALFESAISFIFSQVDGTSSAYITSRQITTAIQGSNVKFLFTVQIYQVRRHSRHFRTIVTSCFPVDLAVIHALRLIAFSCVIDSWRQICSYWTSSAALVFA